MLRLIGMLILVLVSAPQLFAQRFLASNEAQNILYAGVPNPVAVVVDGCNCNQLEIKIDNGTIENASPDNFSCKYVITPESLKTVYVHVYKKGKKDLKKIGVMPFRVHRLPDPQPMVGVLESDTVNKRTFISMGGVRAILTDNIACADFSVESYKMTLIRTNSVITTVNNIGARYSSDVMKHLKELQINDKVIVSDIVVQFPDGTTHTLKTMLFYTIVE